MFRLWEMSSGRCVRTFIGHGGVDCLCRGADDRWALSGSWDKLRLWEVSTGQCVYTFEGHTDSVNSVCLTPDGRWALSGSSDNTMRLWGLDWDIKVMEPADWDEGARSYLVNYLTLCTPYAGTLSKDHEPTEEDIHRALSRTGPPDMTLVEQNFKDLLDTLGNANYGWLRPEGVKKELMKMAANWQGPPPLPSC